MKKKHHPRAKHLTLRAAPLLLTEVRGGQWSGGVLFIDADSGPEAETLALGPNAMLQLLQVLKSAMQDNVSPFSRAGRTAAAAADIQTQPNT